MMLKQLKQNRTGQDIASDIVVAGTVRYGVLENDLDECNLHPQSVHIHHPH